MNPVTAPPAEATPGRWAAGQLLCFSGLEGPTDYDHGLVARTADRGGCLNLCLPTAGRVELTSCVCPSIEVGGDFFVVYCQQGRREGVFVDAHHLLIRGEARVEGDGYRAQSADGYTLVGVEGFFKPELLEPAHRERAMQDHWDRSAWLRGVAHAEVPQQEAAALDKALLMIRTQVMSAEGSIRRRWSTPDRWPHRKMWLWDSVFHAIGWRHIDLPLAQEVLEAVFDVQRDDGFIPHMASPFEASDITQPPVLAYGVWLLVEQGAPLAWAEALLPRLVAYLEWNKAHRDTDGNGLLEWFIEADENCRSGESGMDNSPRFDEATQLDAVDLNAFMANEYRCLARIADRLGLADQQERFTREQARFNELINRYGWNPETGFYHDFDPIAGVQTPVLTSAGFLPLLSGAASPQQAQRLVDHLSDPETFGTAFPIASVSRGSRQGHDKDMWRGPTWININWLVAEALEDYGFNDQAEGLRRQTRAMLTKYHDRFGTFFEFYDEDDVIAPPKLPRKGRNDPEASPMHQVIYEFGWSASLFIDLIYRDTAR